MIKGVSLANINSVRNNNMQRPQKNELKQASSLRQSLGMPKGLHPVYFTGVKVPKNLPSDWRGPLPNEAEKFIDYIQLRGTIPKVLDTSIEEKSGRAFKKSFKNKADFKERNLSKLSFDKSVFYEGDFSNSKLIGTNFDNTNLFGSKFIGAEMGKDGNKNTNFRCADLGSCDFTNAKFTSKTDMEKANLMNTNFSNTEGKYLNLTNAFYNDNTKLPIGIDPEDYQMIKIEKGADLSKSGLEKYGDEDFSITLDNAKFRYGTFVKVDFRKASAKRIDFKRSYINDCKMDETDLSRSYFREAIIEDTPMKKAKLKQANFKYAQLMNVDMEGADLRGAILKWKKAEKVNLKGAKYDDVTDFNEGFDPEKHGMIKVETHWGSYGYKANKD